MREDMAKVIVERPRLCGGASVKPKGYRRRLDRMPAEDWPRRESMKFRWGNHTKAFNEHLGPLRRFLDRRVGCRWDDVYAEICERLDRNSVIQDHVRDHVDQYVSRHVILVHGWPYQAVGRWPLPPGWWYVCPRTGRLKKVPGRRRQRRSLGAAPDPFARGIRVGDRLQCRRIKGRWHLVELRLLATQAGWDVILNRSVARNDSDAQAARQTYGALVYAVSVRRLSHRELSQFPIPRDQWR